MLFYLIFILFVLCVFSLINIWKYKGGIRYKHYLLLFLELIIIVIFVFRYDVGWDYVNYYLWVEDNVSNPRLEPLSALFVWIAQSFKSPTLLFVLFGSFTYIFIFQAIRKKSYNVEFSLLIYLCLFLFDSLGLIRQSLAVAITFWGFKYIQDGKFWRYISVVLLAVGFHYAAVIAIFVYPLYRMRFLILILSLIGIFLLKELLFYLIMSEGTYAVYLLSENMMSGGSKIFVFYIILLSFLSVSVVRNRNNKELVGLYKIVLPILFFLLLLGGGIAIRLSSFFSIYLVLLIPLSLKKNPRIRMILGFILVSYFISMLFISSFNQIKSPYLPYKCVFINGNDSFK